MTDHELNYQRLQELLRGRDYVRFENRPYMPLVVERFHDSFISLCHYGELNGDLMRDPEVVFLVEEEKAAKPVYFRNDYAGVEHATVAEQFGDVPVMPHLQKGLESFVKEWWSNIEAQGFFKVAEKLPLEAGQGPGEGQISPREHER